MFKVRRGSGEEIPLIQGKEQQLQFAGVALKRYPTSKVREFQKSNNFCFIDYAKGFDCVDHYKLCKILRDGNTRPPYLPPEKYVCRSKSNS